MDELEIIIDNLRYEEEGEDFKPHTRLYKEAVVGEFALEVNGAKPYPDHPRDANITDTAKNFLKVLEKSEEGFEGYVLTCICGDKACGKMRWEVYEENELFKIKMSDNIEEIGEYRISRKNYLKQLQLLLEKLNAFMKSKNIAEKDGADLEMLEEEFNQIEKELD